MPAAALENEVRVHFLETQCAEQSAWSEAAETLLDDDERRRWRRFVFDDDRRRFLLSHAMLRTVLSHYADDVPPSAWRFRQNEFGRPEIAEPAETAGLSFNLSHTRGLAACAVTRGRAVGVDVEDLARATPTAELAERYFSALELADMRALPSERRSERFFELWTLKEAYLKARGVGLSLGLDRFSIHFPAGDPPAISFAPGFVDDPAGWQFAQFRPTPRHLLAVAVGRPPGIAFRVAIERFPGN